VPDPTVSVVIPTHNRCATCLEAVGSALVQDPPPLEVLVCDDASTDATRGTFEHDPRVRYLHLDRSHGGPATARNLGLREARGDWVALLDDDDAWLPGKLAAQLPWLRAGDDDVVASDARRASGGRYLDRAADWRPGRQDLLDDNPVITSSAVVRRSALVAAGGFPTQRWLNGVEDYAAWLRMSDRGARFLVLDAPLVAYRDDDAAGRLSARDARVQRALARLAVQRWLRRPHRFELLRAAGNQAVRSARTLRAAG
jgi:glycosyltransferase involved in cell wall biosynthesis